MKTTETLISNMILTAKECAGIKVTQNEYNIANEIAKHIINGQIHGVDVQNSTRLQRKKLIGIAFNLLPNDPLWCKLMRHKDTQICETCNRTCCYNKRLQTRFAEEMYPGGKLY